ncbi:Lectin-domain containing receptor kinase [Quillaja saponaria]|uniref:Lectin-domain containing receptor kinase n=1 Tax=Quillaja saponaria TaxID=32244 RepID=A0AAD7P6R6_QUISA|nr:Lectin-domain containing receptor kinase [Quillaja saponaria]
MQDPGIPLSEEFLNLKPRKKKISTHKASLFQLQANNVKSIQELQGSLPPKNRQKASKRKLKNEVSPSFHKPERSNSDSLPDSSASGNDYRALRRKYLLLEEDSFALGTELREVEDEVKTLEDEKLELLDQLVVLEGLIDPSEMQSQRLHFTNT